MRAGEPRFLRVKNFERMQHYKDRRPPWVKLYVDLPKDPQMSGLPWEARLLYVLLLCVAGAEDNHFPANPVWISEEVRMPLGPVRKGLLLLVDNGFLLADVVVGDLLANDTEEGDSPRARTRSASVSVSSPKTLSLDERGVGGETNGAVGEIYGHWRKVRGKTDARYGRISDGRKRKIQSRLREFSAEDLIRAIDAVALDPWEDRPRHDDLTIIFRSQEQVDKFLALRDASRNGGRPAEDAADRVQRLMAERGL